MKTTKHIPSGCGDYYTLTIKGHTLGTWIYKCGECGELITQTVQDGELGYRRITAYEKNRYGIEEDS